MKKEKQLFKYDEMVNNILETSYSFIKSRTLLTAFELDIFTIIGENAVYSHDVAQVLNANKRGMERLLNALVSMELLEKEGNKYRNTKASYTLLVRGNPNFMGNLDYVAFLWKRWESLTESVLKGKAVDAIPVNKRTDKDIEYFLMAQHWRANNFATDIINFSEQQHIDSVLDLGCGSGAVGMAFKSAYPNAKVTLFDFPNVIEKTKDYVERKSMTDSVNIIAGDMLIDDIGKTYDIVVLSHVLHSYSFWDCLTILRKVFDSLNPGGKVVIHEYLIKDTRDNPEFEALSSLNLLVVTAGGDVFTETDLWLLLKESMFSDLVKHETKYGTYVITAKK